MPNVLQSGSLNLLEPSGPVRACNGIALPLPLPLPRYIYIYLQEGSKHLNGKQCSSRISSLFLKVSQYIAAKLLKGGETQTKKSNFVFMGMII